MKAIVAIARYKEVGFGGDSLSFNLDSMISYELYAPMCLMVNLKQKAAPFKTFARKIS
jgi:hypothetical protein